MNDFERNGSPERREKGEQFSDLVIFTTTRYGNDEVSLTRSALAEDFFRRAKEMNIRCVVVDGGSTPEFLKRIEQFDNVKVIVDPSLGMGESRRKALQEATQIVADDVKSPNFLWTEPEKNGLITAENLDKMISGLRSDLTDIVVPARKSKDTLPKFQAWIESRANKRAMKAAEIPPEAIERELDLWFGPKMFNRAGAQYFLDYKGGLDKWDAIIKPVIDAYKDNKRISAVPVEFFYDESQREQEEGSREFKKKRFEQYSQILAELGDEFWKDKLEETK